MGHLRVRDLMTAEPVSVRSGDSVRVAYELMDLYRVRHLPVVNDEGDLAGLVSHRDLLRSAMGEVGELPLNAQREVLDTMTVSEIMTIVPETVEPEALLHDAGQLLLEFKFGCLPVLEGDRLVGIITEADFVRHVVREEGG